MFSQFLSPTSPNHKRGLETPRILVIECKNTNKDEAIALGVDQIRRYHRETPELFVPQQLFTAAGAIGFSYRVS